VTTKEHETMKYMLMYASDLTKPLSKPEMAPFRSRLGLVWFVIRNKQARAAVLANRFQVLVVKST
jgi:tryptophan-rich sensory protein